MTKHSDNRYAFISHSRSEHGLFTHIMAVLEIGNFSGVLPGLIVTFFLTEVTNKFALRLDVHGSLWYVDINFSAFTLLNLGMYVLVIHLGM